MIDLDDPFSEPRWLHHVTSWEVADVQWSPHSSKPSWCVSTSNQKLMVWNLARSSENAIEHVLHGHSRAVTDINFHPKDPELLALCSVDTFVSVWDLRTPRRPVVNFADWRAGASQVKWNFINPYTVASSHDNYFYIWDTRKGAQPIHKINAHTRRINGLDFGRLYENEIISCSNDLTVKFWDYGKSTESPTYTINTDFPVSRARHLPFGISTCGIMPSAGGNNSIHIVNYKDQTGVSKMKSTHVFKGHSEPVKDFLWRQRHSFDSEIDDREYQLVTWSKDCDLRLWPMNSDFYEKANFERNVKLPEGTKLPSYNYQTFRNEPELNDVNDDEILSAIARNSSGQFVTTKTGSNTTNTLNNQLNWISGVRIGRSLMPAANNRNIFEGVDDLDSQIANFGEEVSSVGHKFPKIRFEKISVSTGNLILSLMGPWSSDSSEEHKDDLVFLRIEADFPRDYPLSNQPPTFKVEDNHELSKEKKLEILKGLEDITTKYSKYNRFCLEPCLRFLMGEKVDLDENFDDDPLMIDPFEIPYDAEEFEYTDSSEDMSVTSDDNDSADELIPATTEANNRIDYGFDSTPVPKGCGAIWTSSGHLICFFLPQAEKPKTTLLKFDQQGFGLTGALAKTSKLSNKSKKVSRLEDSEDSESESESLSDESFSNDWDDILQDDVPRISRFLKNNIGIRQYGMNKKPSTATNNLSLPTAQSQGSHSLRGGSGVKNVISFHDFRHLIPSKMELAYEYRILGSSPEELARHNAIVAEKYGYHQIADCWKILSVVLTKDVEMQIDDEFQTSSFQKEIDKLFQQGPMETNVINFRFYWGLHPFGARWLAKKLIDFYERKNDIQMLLMLSCILFENPEHKSDPTVPIHTPYKKEKQRIKASVAFSVSNGSLSHNSWNNRMISTPRMDSIASSMSSFERGSVKSGSPDRFNSYFKKQIQSPFQVRRDSYLVETPGTMSSVRTPSYFHLPSITSIREERMTSVVSSSEPQQLSRHSSVVGVNGLAPKITVQELPQVNIEFLDKEKLDVFDDVYSISMLDPTDELKLKRYREEYASILYLWGLHASRVKILKFNYPKTQLKSLKTKSEFDIHKVNIGYSDAVTSQIDPDDPLYIPTTSKSKICNYCGLLVLKRLFVCSKCAHLLHAECASQWWTKSEQTECPSGCGCHCLENNLHV